MKKHKRIEITAFRRRFLIVSDDPSTETVETDVRVSDADSQEMIESTSDEGQEILTEAIRLLEERIDLTTRRTA